MLSYDSEKKQTVIRQTEWPDILSPIDIVKGKRIVYTAGHGDVAQLGEHLLCKQGVVGSIPIVSTCPKAL